MDDLIRLRCTLYYEDCAVGTTWHSVGRTVLECNRRMAVNLAWFPEDIFSIQRDRRNNAIAGRPVPLAMAFEMAKQDSKVVEEILTKDGAAVASNDGASECACANRIVQTAIDALGHVAWVINDGDILCGRFIFTISPDVWKFVIDVHLLGSSYVVHAAAPHFKSQNSNSYVRITSTPAFIGNPGHIPGQLHGDEAGHRRAIALHRTWTWRSSAFARTASKRSHRATWPAPVQRTRPNRRRVWKG